MGCIPTRQRTWLCHSVSKSLDLSRRAWRALSGAGLDLCIVLSTPMAANGWWNSRERFLGPEFQPFAMDRLLGHNWPPVHQRVQRSTCRQEASSLAPWLCWQGPSHWQRIRLRTCRQSGTRSARVCDLVRPTTGLWCSRWQKERSMWRWSLSWKLCLELTRRGFCCGCAGSYAVLSGARPRTSVTNCGNVFVSDFTRLSNYAKSVRISSKVFSVSKAVKMPMRLYLPQSRRAYHPHCSYSSRGRNLGCIWEARQRAILESKCFAYLVCADLEK